MRVIALLVWLATALLGLTMSVAAQSITPQSVHNADGTWSFGWFAADGTNAAVLLNGQWLPEWYGSILEVGPDGHLYLRGLTLWWVWNGHYFVESAAGPPHSSIPGGARAAGFNTVALNEDFTKQKPADWLGGCAHAGDGRPVLPWGQDDHGHTWWLNFWWAYGSQPCLTAQRQDPQYGGLALDLPWHVNTAKAAEGTVIESISENYNSQNHTGTAIAFPLGSYYQIIARFSPTDLPGVLLTLHTWGPDGVWSYDCGCVIEWDVMETSGPEVWKYDSAVHNWGAGGGGFILHPWRPEDLAPGTRFDPATYNIYGLRVTYDGSSRAVGCTYVNDVFQRCAEIQIGDRERNARHFLIVGNLCDYWNQPNGRCQDGVETHVYVRKVEVFSCAQWQAGACPGTLLATGP